MLIGDSVFEKKRRNLFHEMVGRIPWTAVLSMDKPSIHG